MYLFTVKNRAGATIKITAYSEDRAKTLAAAAGHVRAAANARITRVQPITVVIDEGWAHINHSGGKKSKRTLVVIDFNRVKHSYPAGVLKGVDW